jgi:crotonobetainyl-CoA:carnitine CoA-transferase CaiB-like acyl-CoA transferase
MMAAQGGAGDPVFLTIGVNDIAAAGMVCASVVAALNARERSGVGQEIKTSLAAMSLLFQTGELVDYAGRPPNETGGQDCVGTRALHRHYRCFDDWIAVACDNRAEAAGLAKALRLELGDPDAALLESADGPLAGRLEAAFAQRRREHVLDDLHGAGVPAVAVIRTLEVFQNDWLWANDYLEFWRHPVRGPAIGARGYGVLSQTPCAFRRPSPELGQHSGEVLREFGFPPERISALAASGAVFDRPLPAELSQASSGKGP